MYLADDIWLPDWARGFARLQVWLIKFHLRTWKATNFPRLYIEFHGEIDIKPIMTREGIGEVSHVEESKGAFWTPAFIPPNHLGQSVEAYHRDTKWEHAFQHETLAGEFWAVQFYDISWSCAL